MFIVVVRRHVSMSQSGQAPSFRSGLLTVGDDDTFVTSLMSSRDRKHA